jgi:hypothetical protein
MLSHHRGQPLQTVSVTPASAAFAGSAYGKYMRQH